MRTALGWLPAALLALGLGLVAMALARGGMAAVAAVFRTVPNGGRIVLQSGIYHGVTTFAEAYCTRRGITLDRVDTSDLSALSGTAFLAEIAAMQHETQQPRIFRT